MIDGADRVVQRVCGRFSWQVLESWASALEPSVAPDWTDLTGASGAELVKRNAQREVWRLRVQGERVFVKVYRRGPVSVAEWQAGRYALAQGLDTVKPIACGVDARRPAAGPSVLVTQELAGAVPLDLYWETIRTASDPTERYRRGRQLIGVLADLLASAHRSGFRHQDLHAANLLVQPSSTGRPRVVLVDLHDVRTGPPVADHEAVHNLVQLNQWFVRHATGAERLRFLKAYLVSREPDSCLRADLRNWAARVDTEAGPHAAALWAKRDRRVVRTGKYFARVQPGSRWRGHVALQCKRPVPGSRASRLVFTSEQGERWLDNPERWFTPARRDLLLKDSASGLVCRAELPVDASSGGPLPIVCKRPRNRNWFKRLWYLFRPSRPVQTFKLGHALLNREIPTARPLAALERRVCGLVVDGLVITEAIPDAEDLDTMLRMKLVHESSGRQRCVKDQLIGELIRLYTGMHKRGCFHRDMKAPNLLVQWSPDRDDPPRITLIDLDGMRIGREVSASQRLRMIMRLNVSLDACRVLTLSDRVRFLKGYLGRHRYNWKTVWQQIDRASLRKRQQKAERQQWQRDPG